MDQLFDSIPKTINDITQDSHATLNELTSTIHALQIHVSGTINQLSEPITESIQIITRAAEQTMVLLRNGFLAMMTAVSLNVLLYLSNFSCFLRAIVWILNVNLCFHIIMTYLRCLKLIHNQLTPNALMNDTQLDTMITLEKFHR